MERNGENPKPINPESSQKRGYNPFEKLVGAIAVFAKSKRSQALVWFGGLVLTATSIEVGGADLALADPDKATPKPDKGTEFPHKTAVIPTNTPDKATPAVTPDDIPHPTATATTTATATRPPATATATRPAATATATSTREATATASPTASPTETQVPTVTATATATSTATRTPITEELIQAEVKKRIDTNLNSKIDEGIDRPWGQDVRVFVDRNRNQQLDSNEPVKTDRTREDDGVATATFTGFGPGDQVCAEEFNLAAELEAVISKVCKVVDQSRSVILGLLNRNKVLPTSTATATVTATATAIATATATPLFDFCPVNPGVQTQEQIQPLIAQGKLIIVNGECQPVQPTATATPRPQITVEVVPPAAGDAGLAVAHETRFGAGLAMIGFAFLGGVLTRLGRDGRRQVELTSDTE